MRPYYSFIFLCYNHWNMSKEAIDTLITSLEDIYIEKGMEIIIVDNASIDETCLGIKEIIEKYNTDVIKIVHIKLDENMGYPVGVNIGLSYCRGEIVSVLNNDLIFIKGWFGGLVEVLETKEQVGVAVPYLSYAYGIQNVGVYLNTKEEINNYAQQYMKDNKNKIIYTTRVIGACMVLKRKVLEDVGGNDFWYGLGHFDDDDWSLRISIAGYKLAIVGGSFVYHIGSVSFQCSTENINKYVGVNRYKFLKKWKLKEDLNLNDMYFERERIIKNTKFIRKKHFIPINLKDFNGFKYTCNDWNGKCKKLLYVVGWKYADDIWKENLRIILKNMNKMNQLFIWIPDQYYNVQEIVKEIEKLINSIKNKAIHSNQYIKYIHDNIEPINMLRFLNTFNIVLEVKGDFINRYIVYLSKKINKTIQEK